MTCNDCTHYAGNGKCRKNKKGTTSPLKVADELKCFEQADPEKPVLPEENKPETKVCKGCGRELPLDAFWRNRQCVTGYCKDCMKEKHAKAAAKREQKYKEHEERMIEQIFGGREHGQLNILVIAGGFPASDCLDNLLLIHLLIFANDDLQGIIPPSSEFLITYYQGNLPLSN